MNSVIYSQGGMYFFNLMDYQTAGISLLIVSLFEIIIIGWIYGKRWVNVNLNGKKCKRNLFTHVTGKGLELVIKCTCMRPNKSSEVLVFVERGKSDNPEKNSRRKDENQRQTQPHIYDGSGKRIRAALVGGE